MIEKNDNLTLYDIFDFQNKNLKRKDLHIEIRSIKFILELEAKYYSRLRFSN